MFNHNNNGEIVVEQWSNYAKMFQPRGNGYSKQCSQVDEFNLDLKIPNCWDVVKISSSHQNVDKKSSSHQNVPTQEYSEHCSHVDENEDKKSSGSNVHQSPNN